MKLQFCGATGTVTGSCYLLEHDGRKLLVDCGMFQGNKSLRQLNYGAFPFDPASIDAVLLTHAHIDHSGLLPKLTRLGFRGRILCTDGTRDLLTYMLPDSAEVQQSDVARLNRRNAQRGGAQVQPIYTRQDAERCLTQIECVQYGDWTDAVAGEPGVQARWWNAAHILGSASIELQVQDKGSITRLLFSGDIGPGDQPLQGLPQAPQDCDVLVMEGTYGDRDRARLDAKARRAVLRQEVDAALKRGGNLIIPAFAVERTQELLADLALLFDSQALPETPVFIDSPLALRATEVFVEHAADLGEGSTPARFRRANFHAAESVDDSKAIARIQRGAIIIAGSGMCDGGRVRHHLKNNLWRPESTVLMVGFQASGTLGQVLLSGVPAVRIHGEEIAVKATIRSIDIYSGHADRGQLLDWAAQRFGARPAARGAKPSIFLTHGEGQALAALRQGLIDAGIKPAALHIPALDESFELDGARLRSLGIAHNLNRPRLTGETATGLDWHNRYADLLMRLATALRGSTSDAARESLLERLRRDLEQGRGEQDRGEQGRGEQDRGEQDRGEQGRGKQDRGARDRNRK
jgi:metallo-beta-lactamase family protein